MSVHIVGVGIYTSYIVLTSEAVKATLSVHLNSYTEIITERSDNEMRWCMSRVSTAFNSVLLENSFDTVDEL